MRIIRLRGELTIVKKGEVLDGFEDDFTYQTGKIWKEQSLKFMQQRDIYTADFQKDDNGNRIPGICSRY